MSRPDKNSKSSKHFLGRSSAASRMAKTKGLLSVLLKARKRSRSTLAPLRTLESSPVLGSASLPAAIPRPQSVYETERATYRSRKADLLRTASGKFVVLKGQELEGPFPDFRSALKAGRRKFGHGPLYIKQVLAEEPAAHSGVVTESCRS
jgi:hypothetical protein